MEIISLDAWDNPLHEASRPFLGGGSDLPTEIRPLADSTQGDLTTDIALRLAGRCKIHSEVLAQKIIDALPPDFPGQCVQVRGYINIQADVSCLLRAESVSAPKFAPASILFCAKPSANPFPAIRLACIAGLHSLIRRYLGGQVRLIGVDRDLMLSAENFNSEIDLIAEAAPNPDSYLEKIAPHVLGQQPEEQKFFWLPSDYASGTNFGRFIRENIRDRPGRLILSVPKELLIRNGGTIRADVAGQLDAMGLLSFMFSLAAPVSGEDFDFDTFRLNEKGNVLWLLSSLSARLRSLLGEYSVSGAPENLSDIDLAYKALFTRSRMLPRFLMSCIEGGVLDFIVVLADFLNRIGRLINTPEFRLAVSRGELSLAQSYILSGVGQALSAIISLVSGCCALLE